MYIQIIFYSLALLVQLLSYIPGIESDCNLCSGLSNVACVSTTQFQTCVANIPSGPINSCPAGYICTAATIICQPNNIGFLPACTGCNQCDATNTFACTGYQTFALCLGTGAISSITGSCEPNYVCSINYQQICGNAAQGVAATCSLFDNSKTTTTTASTITGYPDPTAYCRSIRQTGRFPYGTTLGTSCKQYIYCYVRSGVWYGILYTCPGNTYFNSSSRQCTKIIPSTCSWTVQNLQLDGFEFV